MTAFDPRNSRPSECIGQFQLGIDGTGKVVECQITESSGYPILDKAACQNAGVRRFHPATDSKGNGIAGTWAGGETFVAPN